MKVIDYRLPEFVFLDGHSHEGDSLADRTVLQHIRTYTIMEVVALDDIDSSSFQAPTFEFEYKNDAGIVERHMLVLHFSLERENSGTLQSVFEKAAVWYCDYLKWEDGNILMNERSVGN